MDINLDNDALVATITDFDATQVTADSVPETYTIVFLPTQDESAINAAFPNRGMQYTKHVSYTSQAFGNGYASIPVVANIQSLSPVQATE